MAIHRRAPTTRTRASVVLALVTVLAAGCGDDESATTTAAPTTAAPATAAPAAAAPATSAPATAAPTTVPADFLAAATQACAMANQEAYTDAERLGYWSKQLTPAEQAEYFSGRAAQVDGLIAALGALAPDAQRVGTWPTTLSHLEAYATWARDNVATIEATGTRVPESSPSSLQAFRAAFELGYGNACQDLFDMN